MPRASPAGRMGLTRAVGALAAASFSLGLGQELWSRYLPEYLRAFGASAVVLGLFGSLQDLLDAAYAYPGGALADRVGSRRALFLVAAASTVGTAVYLTAGSVAALFAGLLLVSAWRSLGLPATFTLVAEELDRKRRIAGFTVQAVVKRLPVVVAPPLGGLLLERLGTRGGMRVGFAISLGLGLGVTVALSRVIVSRETVRPRPTGLPSPLAPMRRRRLPPVMARLLVADCLVRLCEGLPAVFLVVWAIEILRISPLQFGLLQSVLMASAILSYAPALTLAERMEKKPFVVSTFLFFTLFPIAVLLSRSFAQLAAAYVVGGLREIGEPARKALLVDLSDRAAPGRTLGLYYAIRGFAVFGAAAIGGALWTIDPRATFLAASALGAAGTIWAAVSLPGRASPAAEAA
jgi:MFS family permease